MLLAGLVVGICLMAAGVGSVPDRVALERLISSTLSNVLCPVLGDGEEAPRLCKRLASDLAPAVVPVVQAVFGSEADVVLECVTGQRRFMDVTDINWAHVVSLHCDPDRVTNRFETLLNTIRPALLPALQALNDRPLVQRIIRGAFMRIAAGILDDGQWMLYGALSLKLVEVAVRRSIIDTKQLSRFVTSLSDASFRDAAVAAAAPYDLDRYVTTVFDRMDGVIRSNMPELRSCLRDAPFVDADGHLHIEEEVAARVLLAIPKAIRQDAADLIEELASRDHLFTSVVSSHVASGLGRLSVFVKSPRFAGDGARLISQTGGAAISLIVWGAAHAVPRRRRPARKALASLLLAVPLLGWLTTRRHRQARARPAPIAGRLWNVVTNRFTVAAGVSALFTIVDVLRRRPGGSSISTVHV
ncbi:Uncharacterized protein PBTT_05171 [Plasmodiophora brassicae]|uniref:Uncharacterized protein n=1 Tax=Plasmodiophora brassicae TaxID=37360 RepID=A0A0G4IX52_PLABS|nr:hypothetical protein PBRA_007417 [Plasmodiophora brassicae]